MPKSILNKELGVMITPSNPNQIDTLADGSLEVGNKKNYMYLNGEHWKVIDTASLSLTENNGQRISASHFVENYFAKVYEVDIKSVLSNELMNDFKSSPEVNQNSNDKKEKTVEIGANFSKEYDNLITQIKKELSKIDDKKANFQLEDTITANLIEKIENSNFPAYAVAYDKIQKVSEVELQDLQAPENFVSDAIDNAVETTSASILERVTSKPDEECSDTEKEYKTLNAIEDKDEQTTSKLDTLKAEILKSYSEEIQDVKDKAEIYAKEHLVELKDALVERINDSRYAVGTRTEKFNVDVEGTNKIKEGKFQSAKAQYEQDMDRISRNIRENGSSKRVSFGRMASIFLLPVGLATGIALSAAFSPLVGLPLGATIIGMTVKGQVRNMQAMKGENLPKTFKLLKFSNPDEAQKIKADFIEAQANYEARQSIENERYDALQECLVEVNMDASDLGIESKKDYRKFLDNNVEKGQLDEARNKVAARHSQKFETVKQAFKSIDEVAADLGDEELSQILSESETKLDKMTGEKGKIEYLLEAELRFRKKIVDLKSDATEKNTRKKIDGKFVEKYKATIEKVSDKISNLKNKLKEATSKEDKNKLKKQIKELEKIEKSCENKVKQLEKSADKNDKDTSKNKAKIERFTEAIESLGGKVKADADFSKNLEKESDIESLKKADEKYFTSKEDEFNALEKEIDNVEKGETVDTDTENQEEVINELAEEQSTEKTEEDAKEDTETEDENPVEEAQEEAAEEPVEEVQEEPAEEPVEDTQVEEPQEAQTESSTETADNSKDIEAIKAELREEYEAKLKEAKDEIRKEYEAKYEAKLEAYDNKIAEQNKEIEKLKAENKVENQPEPTVETKDTEKRSFSDNAEKKFTNNIITKGIIAKLSGDVSAGENSVFKIAQNSEVRGTLLDAFYQCKSFKNETDFPGETYSNFRAALDTVTAIQDSYAIHQGSVGTQFALTSMSPTEFAGELMSGDFTSEGGTSSTPVEIRFEQNPETNEKLLVFEVNGENIEIPMSKYEKLSDAQGKLLEKIKAEIDKAENNPESPAEPFYEAISDMIIDAYPEGSPEATEKLDEFEKLIDNIDAKEETLESVENKIENVEKAGEPRYEITDDGNIEYSEKGETKTYTPEEFAEELKADPQLQSDLQSLEQTTEQANTEQQQTLEEQNVAQPVEAQKSDIPVAQNPIDQQPAMERQPGHLRGLLNQMVENQANAILHPVENLKTQFKDDKFSFAHPVEAKKAAIGSDFQKMGALLEALGKAIGSDKLQNIGEKLYNKGSQMKDEVDAFKKELAGKGADADAEAKADNDEDVQKADAELQQDAMDTLNEIPADTGADNNAENQVENSTDMGADDFDAGEAVAAII